MASGGAAGATSLAFVYSLDYARTRLANDSKSAKKGGTREFNGMVDVYRKTMASDGIAGLYRGFVISCVGIVVYRGLYFGMYDSLKPVLLTGDLAVRSARACGAMRKEGGEAQAGQPAPFAARPGSGHAPRVARSRGSRRACAQDGRGAVSPFAGPHPSSDLPSASPAFQRDHRTTSWRRSCWAGASPSARAWPATPSTPCGGA